LKKALTAAVVASLALVAVSAAQAEPSIEVGKLDARTSSAPKRHARALAIANLTLPSAPLREGVPALGRLRFRTLISSVSQPTPYVTPDGMTVYVSSSDLYTPDPAAAQSYVNFLGWLTHGPELNGLYVFILTPAEVTAYCGGFAAACWSTASSIPGGFMVVAGEDTGGIPIEQAVAHEFGHHIAFHRVNTPWQAVEWGPKRWANYENVCANTANGNLFPGDEGAHYTLNPGEGWAEGYRQMNELRAEGTWRPLGWVVVDPFFMPDSTDLALISQDVMDPWSGPTPYVMQGRLRKGGVRRWTMHPYDGPMTASITGRPGTTVSFSVGGRIVRGPARRISTLVCGATSVKVVAHSKQGGRFVLRITEDDS